MKKLNATQMEKFEGGVCFDIPQSPPGECFSVCLVGAALSQNIETLVGFVTGDLFCIL